MPRSKIYNHPVPKVVVGVFGLALSAAAFYQVRELLAALVIFSVVFSTVGTAFLILVLIEEAALKGITLLEARMVCVRARYTAVSAHLHGEHIPESPRWNRWK